LFPGKVPLRKVPLPGPLRSYIAR